MIARILVPLTSITLLIAPACSDTTTAPAPRVAPSAPRYDGDARGAAAQPYTFYSLDVPCSACANGVALAQPSGINAVGDVVGGFTDAVGGQHGFLLSRGRFTSIDVPGSLVGVAGTLPTSANGINPSGDIVGSFAAPYNPPVSTTAGLNDARYCPAKGSPACSKGFLYSKGTFSLLLFRDHPGATPQHILPNGTVFGCLHDYDLMGSMFGAVWSRSGDASLRAGGGVLNDATLSAPSSMINGIAGNGVMVGFGNDPNRSNQRAGIIVQNGDLRFYNFPSATTSLTAIWDMNAGGQFVGTYIDATGRHGFVQNPDGSAPIQLDVPGGANTLAKGINPEGMIVGTYTVSGKTHGFLAVPPSE